MNGRCKPRTWLPCGAWKGRVERSGTAPGTPRWARSSPSSSASRPDAEDPVNALLNIGFTLLYRLTTLAAKAAGLHPGLGFLHSQTGRFHSLASDLQEPLRFLIDRGVIEATHKLRPQDFRRVERGPYPLAIEPHAAREFQALLWRNLYLGCQLEGQEAQLSYLVHLQRQARRLRRALLSAEVEFKAFRLP